jgi:hypothetical protein
MKYTFVIDVRLSKQFQNLIANNLRLWQKRFKKEFREGISTPSLGHFRSGLDLGKNIFVIKHQKL